MRILLVRPRVPRHTIGLKNIMICEPLELEYAAASIDRSHEVQIFDGILERDLEGRLRSFRPDIVGTSSYISGVNEAKRVCRLAKTRNPDCVTVVGGVHAARVAEDFIDAAVDCIALGDGTTTLPDIVRAVMCGEPLSSVQGLALPARSDEPEPRLVLIKTAARDYMPPPDTLPLPRRELVSHLQSKYYYLTHLPVATMKTTWGCWYKCNFCYTWRITDGKPYSRSPESIVEEMATIEAEDIYIVDDIFLIGRSRLRRMAELIRTRGIKKRFLVYARADFLAENEDLVAEWAELGLSSVFVGLEAATDPELDSMDKACSVDENRAAIQVLRKYGVDIYASLIPDPEYTEADWDRLWHFIEDNGLYYVNISPLTPMPGTQIWDEYKTRITVPRDAHGLWDLSHVLLPTRMSLKSYYRSLLRLYCRTCLDIRRARRLAIHNRPSVFSKAYFRLWLGAVRIFFQFLGAHKHHRHAELARAQDAGPAVAIPDSLPTVPRVGSVGADGKLHSIRRSRRATRTEVTT
jgi:radical SAM superfamily enzyme YgiQ (UPF0313 family)